MAAARLSGAVPGKKSLRLRIGRASGVPPTASAEDDGRREEILVDPDGLEIWGYPQIIQVMDDQSIVSKPMGFGGPGLQENLQEPSRT